MAFFFSGIVYLSGSNLCFLQHSTHSNATHVREMQRQAVELLEMEGGPGWFGDCGSGPGSQRADRSPAAGGSAGEQCRALAKPALTTKRAAYTQTKPRARARGRGEGELLAIIAPT